MTFLAGGLFASSMSKTTGTATAVSYAITGVICVGTLIPIAMADRMAPVLANAIHNLQSGRRRHTGHERGLHELPDPLEIQHRRHGPG